MTRQIAKEAGLEATRFVYDTVEAATEDKIKYTDQGFTVHFVMESKPGGVKKYRLWANQLFFKQDRLLRLQEDVRLCDKLLNERTKEFNERIERLRQAKREAQDNLAKFIADNK